MTNATKLASGDERNDLYDRVLTDWQLRLRDGKWLSTKSLLQSTSAELCDAFLKIASNSACDLANPHELCWAAFDKYVLPKLLADDDYEERTHNGQLEVSCCKPAAPINSSKSVDLNIQQTLAPTPATGTDSVRANAAPASVPATAHENEPAVVEQTQFEKSPSPMAPQMSPASVDPMALAGAHAARPPIHTRLPIDKVQVGQRHRQDLGDIPALAASIKCLGLLQSILVTPDYRLIAGERRLAALKHLGRLEVPVVVVTHLDDALHLLQAERDENSCRKGFTLSEAVALGQAIEALERPQAKQRQCEHGGTAPGRKKNNSGKLPGVSSGGRTRDKVALAVGMSGRTYEKTKAVVEAAEENPERYGPLVEQMDKTGKVDAAYREVKRHSASKSKQKAGASKPSTSVGGNGKVETLAISKPTTVADKHALATKLSKFLGHDLCEELARLWTTANKRTERASPSAKRPKLRQAPGRHGARLDLMMM